MKNPSEIIADKIEITTEGTYGNVKINGREVKGVRSYRLEHKAGDVPKLYLELNALNATVDSKRITVALPEIYDCFELKTREE